MNDVPNSFLALSPLIRRYTEQLPLYYIRILSPLVAPPPYPAAGRRQILPSRSLTLRGGCRGAN
ncbi:hypothetical protein KCP76_19805 [Salmonella enterica subsp. enterica serovar Weltevreden]|nr:hypothetical protein KCP76_19805 [Salmonella enterica subsp. enterica serovar Weltevreden]